MEKDMSKVGPQITARPGTKRHQQQCVARRAFFNIMASQEQAEVARIQAQIHGLATIYLAVSPAAGNA